MSRSGVLSLNHTVQDEAFAFSIRRERTLGARSCVCCSAATTTLWRYRCEEAGGGLARMPAV